MFFFGSGNMLYEYLYLLILLSNNIYDHDGVAWQQFFFFDLSYNDC